jgi:nicotinamide-nucleotide amidase
MSEHDLTGLIHILIQKQWRIAVVESCTGGGFAKALTDVPGSSLWFDCALVTYSDASKIQLCGVDPQVIAAEGAVSEAVACQMVSGLAKQSTAQVRVAITGVAGPGGGTKDKPVGLVWFAFDSPLNDQPVTVRQDFMGDRSSVRRLARQFALRYLCQDLLS